ncbi:HNH endonuclease [Allosphingosinicella deserti]|uniref:Endonuclease n=1 Tax=Allosphingosinicella deserti TaxID=2116704 RepID=A0A2P7QW18_9SPHN|nr:HNH endonuclease signature motif containing protein [Sphingomonas deserti]PSJ42156.1 endonuclease [Sphingomonas deserti]
MSRWDHGGKTTSQRGYGTQHQRIREQLKREVILCELCQRKTPPVVRVGCIADHIVSLAKGGTGDRSNYQWICRECADEKDAHDRGKPLKPKPRIGPSGWPE